MSVPISSPATAEAPEGVTAAPGLADYVELTKPRVVSMVLVTTCVGYYLGANASTGLAALFHVLVGTALAAGGTLAINEYMERDLDALMHRTRGRPIPSGRIEAGAALIFGCVVAAIGIVYTTLMVDPLTAGLTATITATYLFVYTPLKKITPLCSLVGSAPGALPPVVGWAAARGDLDVGAWVLFAILFLWQMPHALAIARLYRDDYARAGIRVLPVIDPDGPSLGHQVVLNSAVLFTVALLPTVVGLSGPIYFACALIMGAGLVYYSLRLARSRSLEDSRRLLFATLVYLPVVLTVMALDKLPS